jgi:hypothetical protein
VASREAGLKPGVRLAFEACGGAGEFGLESDDSGFSRRGIVNNALAHGRTVSKTARKRARMGCIKETLRLPRA